MDFVFFKPLYRYIKNYPTHLINISLSPKFSNLDLRNKNIIKNFGFQFNSNEHVNVNPYNTLSIKIYYTVCIDI